MDDTNFYAYATNELSYQVEQLELAQGEFVILLLIFGALLFLSYRAGRR